jgi:4a-hydroxytetrahydrobiopterin dehydratase
MKKLEKPEINTLLANIPGWSLDRSGESIESTRTFETFLKAIDFVNRVANLAERADHHPDIDIRYSKITLRLSTHSVGGITDRDFALAKQINEL